ncbi:hypothetical protein PGTUg99_031984 [Puccinia graminis f. sp. tritici]|uniref:Uncharacterized protein n=1 Tax=Puccinia graminis f. sp. tritici TaxID=56615 RepID=A0A5B0R926_PUCGR|nr:hypothetical protein PGTUg99_031984 [Puccinia graminis f. sp. tritici]
METRNETPRPPLLKPRKSTLKTHLSYLENPFLELLSNLENSLPTSLSPSHTPQGPQENTPIALGTTPRPPNNPGLSLDAPEPTGLSSDDPDRSSAPQSTPQNASALPIAHRGLLKAPDTCRQAPEHQATPQSTQQPTGAPPSHPVTP